MRVLYFAVAVAVAACLPALVLGHGWMMDPVPRSGGGTGSGNASTRRPCGKGDSTAITATYTAGATIPITFKRANGHGVSCNCVDIVLSFAAAAADAPTNAHFEGADGIVLATNRPLDTTTSDPQTTMVTLPNTPGDAVLQWSWEPTSGGRWLDCAYIRIEQGGACAENNGGCSDDASCANTNNGETAVCTCRGGFFGDGRTCTPLPADVPVTLVVSGDVVQDEFTENLATQLGVDPGLINFDAATPLNETVAVVTFAVGPNPQTGEDGTRHAQAIRSWVGQGNEGFAEAIGHDILSVQLATDAEPVGFGTQPADGDDINYGLVAGGLIASVFAVVAGFFIIKTFREKRQGGGGGGGGGNASAFSHQTAAPMVAARQPEPVQHVQQPSGAVGGSGDVWEEHQTDDGLTYYFNSVTGVSVWEDPR